MVYLLYRLVFMCAILAVVLPGAQFRTFALNSLAGYDDVRQILDALVDILPSGLKASDESARRKAWENWVIGHDHEIRARLARGDKDTVVNWLLSGTSFTSQPRPLFDVPATSESLPELISARIRDLVSALALTDQDERRNFARQLLQSQGYRFDEVAERMRLQQHLQTEVARVVAEFQQYTRELNAARLSGDVAKQVMTESGLFQNRGLSLDTSILPGFAIEKALETMRNHQLFSANAIRRVAVIGPGLDFSDKNSGYDFYPVQTLQPFTLIDSVVRLGLAEQPDAVEVTTFDISARVNDHEHALRDRAKSGDPYVLHLPLDIGSPWRPDLVKYWKSMGDRIGAEIAVPKPPASGKQLDLRGIRVHPPIASRITAVDFNAVTERWTGLPFDIVVATNVLVYYDTLDQALAFASIEAMLRPGGFFLTNNAIVELPASRLRSQGFVTIQYSTDLARGDLIFWYRRNQ
jgi:hypothetical protein